MDQLETPAARVAVCNEAPVASDGGYVLYWMSRTQRADDNHALEHAVRLANAHERPLLALFALTDYPEANLRHVDFMLRGLAETQAALAERGVRLVVRRGPPADVVITAAAAATAVVVDKAYLRPGRQWRADVAQAISCRLVEVETDLVVPVEAASDKREYAARTLRPKLHRRLDDFLAPVEHETLERPSVDVAWAGDVAPPDGAPKGDTDRPDVTLAPDPAHPDVELSDVDAALARLDLDRTVAPVGWYLAPGAAAAKQRWQAFLAESAGRYVKHSQRPETDDVSHMSAYLHFGQVSPLWLLGELRASDVSDDIREALVEQLVVRRELAFNFVYYAPQAYDRYETLPDWAHTTLAVHADDRRQPSYTRAELEAAETHDDYWNAAMREMKATGYLHNYMRMYWGKKILEWSPSPQAAFETALALNNRYFLDGRDPLSFANVLWLFGLHDRAWAEREIYGKVRYMSAGGLERKSDTEAYLAKVDRLEARAAEAAERAGES